MITIIVGTNRPKSNSEVVALNYLRMLEDAGEEGQVLNLSSLPNDFIFTDMFGARSEAIDGVIQRYILPVQKFVFIIPEYNGGFPGVLKAFIDCVPPKLFHDKKAGLIGLSSGHTGSLRGMDQFSNVLNYLRVNVLYAKPKLSNIEALIADTQITDERANKQLHDHVQMITSF